MDTLSVVIRLATLGLAVQFCALVFYVMAIVENHRKDSNYKDTFEKSFGLFVASTIPWVAAYITLILAI